ncbi:MAG: HEAT repeat domain-containing protein [Pirellulales bacterium]|nr:HEAT repeat domain-containing protein [Pirellulales bacterium]
MKTKKAIRWAVVPCVVWFLPTLCAAADKTSPADEARALAKDFQGKDLHKRWEALLRLEELGLDAAPACAALIGVLDDKDVEARRRAIELLGQLEQDAEPAIPTLIKLLAESTFPKILSDMGGGPPDIGFHAAHALGQIGPPAMKPLTACLSDRRIAVRANAAFALGYMGSEARPATDHLLIASMDKDKSVRLEAVWALGQITPDPQRVVPGLVGRLADENVSVRRVTVESLATLRPVKPLAVQGLIHALGDEDGAVQARAAGVLGELGPRAKAAVKPLTKMLRSEASHPVPFGHPFFSDAVSATAAEALGRIGPEAKPALPELLAAIGDSDRKFREYSTLTKNRAIRPAAMRAAARIAPESPALLAALEESLLDQSVAVDAARALAMLGPKARRSIPLLITQLKDADSYERLNLALVIVSIQPDHELGNKVLLEELEDLDRDNTDWDLLVSVLRRSPKKYVKIIPTMANLPGIPGEEGRTANVLALFGADARSAVPTLIGSIGNAYDEERPEVIAALGKIASSDSEPLREALKDYVEDKVSQDGVAVIRAGVAEVFGYFPDSVPLLTETLRDPSPVVRIGVVKGLARRGKDGVGPLLTVLKDPSARVRREAVGALAACPEGARRSLAQLPKLMQDDSRTVRKAAWEAIQRLEKAEPPAAK